MTYSFFFVFVLHIPSYGVLNWIPKDLRTSLKMQKANSQIHRKCQAWWLFWKWYFSIGISTKSFNIWRICANFSYFEKPTIWTHEYNQSFWWSEQVLVATILLHCNIIEVAIMFSQSFEELTFHHSPLLPNTFM